MKYTIIIFCLSCVVGCALRHSTPNVFGPPSPNGEDHLVSTLITDNMSLTEKEKAYRNMIVAGQIGLAAVLQHEKDDEIAQARKIALWVSLASILGFVAGCVLLYLGSKIFGMIALVASGALLVGCIAYASFIAWAGPILAALLGTTVIGFLAYELWKHRAALFYQSDAIPPGKNPPVMVHRLIQKVQKRADALAAQAKTSVDDTLKKVG